MSTNPKLFVLTLEVLLPGNPGPVKEMEAVCKVKSTIKRVIPGSETPYATFEKVRGK